MKTPKAITLMALAMLLGTAPALAQRGGGSRSGGSSSHSSGSVSRSSGGSSHSGGSVSRSTSSPSRSSSSVSRSSATPSRSSSSVSRSSATPSRSSSVSRSNSAPSRTFGSIDRSSATPSRSTGSVNRSSATPSRSAGSVNRSSATPSRSAGVVNRSAGSPERAATGTPRTGQAPSRAQAPGGGVHSQPMVRNQRGGQPMHGPATPPPPADRPIHHAPYFHHPWMGHHVHCHPIFWDPIPPRPWYWPGFWLYCNSYWYDYHVTDVVVVHDYVAQNYQVDLVTYAISGDIMYAIVRDKGDTYLQVYDKDDHLLAEQKVNKRYCNMSIDTENGGCWISKKNNKDALLFIWTGEKLLIYEAD